jgi:hypothetical protein
VTAAVPMPLLPIPHAYVELGDGDHRNGHGPFDGLQERNGIGVIAKRSSRPVQRPRAWRRRASRPWG